jgi:TGS domain
VVPSRLNNNQQQQRPQRQRRRKRTMGKKEKKGASAGESGSSNGGIGINATGKFAVLDYPGVKQELSFAAPVATASASAAAKDGAQGRRATAGSGPKIVEGNLIGGDSWTGRQANPAWLQERQAKYNAIAAKRLSEWNTKQQVPITVTMPDGKVLETDKATGEAFLAWKSTPYDVAATISQGLADAATVARVTYSNFVDDYDLSQDGMDGVDTMADAMADAGLLEDENEQAAEDTTKKTLLWDMTRPLVGNVSKLELLKFDDAKDAQTVFWHSSAHIMGEALEHAYGCKLTIGPPLQGGFYYDSYMGSDALKEEDCTCIIISLMHEGIGSSLVLFSSLFACTYSRFAFYPTHLRTCVHPSRCTY